jgi:hypothetical protein
MQGEVEEEVGVVAVDLFLDVLHLWAEVGDDLPIMV